MKNSSGTQLTNYRFVVGLLIGLFGFSTGLNMLVTGPITPLIIDTYGINNSTAGLLTSIIFIVKGVVSLYSSFPIGINTWKEMSCGFPLFGFGESVIIKSSFK